MPTAGGNKWVKDVALDDRKLLIKAVWDNENSPPLKHVLHQTQLTQQKIHMQPKTWGTNYSGTGQAGTVQEGEQRINTIL